MSHRRSSPTVVSTLFAIAILFGAHAANAGQLSRGYIAPYSVSESEPVHDVEILKTSKKRRQKTRAKTDPLPVADDPLDDLSFSDRYFPMSTDELVPALDNVAFATRCLSPVMFGSLWVPWLFNDDPNKPGIGSDQIASWIVPFLVTLAASNLLWIGPAIFGGIGATVGALLGTPIERYPGGPTYTAELGVLGLLLGAAIGLVVPAIVWGLLAFWVTPNASLNAWNRAYVRERPDSTSYNATKRRQELTMAF